MRCSAVPGPTNVKLSRAASSRVHTFERRASNGPPSTGGRRAVRLYAKVLHLDLWWVWPIPTGRTQDGHLSVVIPAWNEAESLQETFVRIREALRSTEADGLE